MTTPRATSRYQATVAIADILAAIKVLSAAIASLGWRRRTRYPPILIEHNAILGRVTTLVRHV
jgi:hypothetical protein